MVGQGNQPVKEKQRETMRASEWGWGVCKGGKMQPTARVQPQKKEAKKSRKADRATSYSPKKRCKKKKAKREPTAPRIPTWSPTVVLTGPAVA